MFSWWVLAGIVTFIAIVVVLLVRSVNKWQQPPTTDPLAQQAEARLWQTKLGEAGGGGGGGS